MEPSSLQIENEKMDKHQKYWENSLSSKPQPFPAHLEILQTPHGYYPLSIIIIPFPSYLIPNLSLLPPMPCAHSVKLAPNLSFSPLLFPFILYTCMLGPSMGLTTR